MNRLKPTRAFLGSFARFDNINDPNFTFTNALKKEALAGATPVIIKGFIGEDISKILDIDSILNKIKQIANIQGIEAYDFGRKKIDFNKPMLFVDIGLKILRKREREKGLNAGEKILKDELTKVKKKRSEKIQILRDKKMIDITDEERRKLIMLDNFEENVIRERTKIFKKEEDEEHLDFIKRIAKDSKVRSQIRKLRERLEK